MTKRQDDDIYWQASFLKHEMPALKMETDPADLSLTNSDTANNASSGFTYLFICQQHNNTLVLLELMLESIDWPISDEFGDGSGHFIFAS